MYRPIPIAIVAVCAAAADTDPAPPAGKPRRSLWTRLQVFLARRLPSLRHIAGAARSQSMPRSGRPSLSTIADLSARRSRRGDA